MAKSVTDNHAQPVANVLSNLLGKPSRPSPLTHVPSTQPIVVETANGLGLEVYRIVKGKEVRASEEEWLKYACHFIETYERDPKHHRSQTIGTPLVVPQEHKLLKMRLPLPMKVLTCPAAMPFVAPSAFAPAVVTQGPSTTPVASTEEISCELQAYCAKMSVPGHEWGDLPELLALSEAHGREIVVYNRQDARSAAEVEARAEQRFELYRGAEFKPETIRGHPIHLLRVGDNHYNRFILAPQESRLDPMLWDTDERRETIDGDGNCLFAAVGKDLGLSHEATRASAVAWLRLHPDAIVPGFEVSVEQYVGGDHILDEFGLRV